MTQTIVDLFKHNIWANLLIVEACSSLSADDLAATCEGTYGPLGDTLVHMLASEGRYLQQFMKVEPDLPLSEGDAPDFALLKTRAHMSGEALVGIAGETGANAVLRGKYGDTEYEMRAIVLLGQAINHATEHRIHIATIMSQRGITPPRIDVLGYWMAGKSG